MNELIIHNAQNLIAGGDVRVSRIGQDPPAE
jgi:hypothetical protein